MSRGMVKIYANEAATPPESIIIPKGRELGEYFFSLFSPDIDVMFEKLNK